MLPTITIGPLVLPTAGLVYIIGAWVVLSVIERTTKALRQNVEATYSLSIIALVAGLVGARLVFVILHWSAYRNNLGGIIWPLTSGFDAWGGLIVGLAGATFYGRSRQLPLEATLDSLAPGLITALMFVSLADLLAGPGYGTRSAVPWAISLFGIRRHPVQIYELFTGGLALLGWWLSYKRQLFAGQLFLSAVAVYSAGRLIFDVFRANSWLTAGGYHIIQIISLVVLLICIYLLGRGYTRDTAEADTPK